MWDSTVFKFIFFRGEESTTFGFQLFAEQSCLSLSDCSVLCLATQSCSTLWLPGLQHARLLCQWGLSWEQYWSELPYPPPSSRSSQPRDQTQVSHIAGRFFTDWATWKPKNIGVGSLSLLWGIIPTQESNWGLPHCRRILLPAELPEKPTQELLESKDFFKDFFFFDVAHF